jgi:serine phosphatase RsbU (regulator of sigma subunit)
MTEVAGDFYDFLVIDQSRLGIFVADVAGHGVPAALIASMLKIAIAAQAEHASDPARVMTALNQTLCGRLQQHLVTAAYLYLDLEKNKMAYAAAGHPPLLWFQYPVQKPCALEENGLLLGVIPNAPYSSVERDISPGDRLLMYTDGLLEASNPADEHFGEAGVKQVLLSAKSVDAGQFATRLFEELAHWTGSGKTQGDDITVVVIDVYGKAVASVPS